MRTKQKLLGLLLTLLICLAPWNGVALAEKLPEIVAIDILTTNDFHGALVEAGKNPGAAKFGAFLLQQRAKNPYGSIFVSAGDMFQGSPDSNLLYGKTVVEVLNALQMDAMTLGNHEFDWGLDWIGVNGHSDPAAALEAFSAEALRDSDAFFGTTPAPHCG